MSQRLAKPTLNQINSFVVIGSLAALIMLSVARGSQARVPFVLRTADEILFVLVAGYAIFQALPLRLPKAITGGLGTVLCICVVSSLVNEVSPIVAILGTLLILKPLVIALAYYLIGQNLELQGKFARRFQLLLAILVIACLLASLQELVTGRPLIDAGFREAPRFGFTAPRGIFPHPGIYSSMMLLCTLFFFLAARATARPGVIVLFLLAVVQVVLAARSKALLTLPFLLVVANTAYGWQRRMQSAFPKRHFVPALAAVGAGSWLLRDQLYFYLFNSDTPVRTALLKASIKINSDFGWLGAGPGRFGSSVSANFRYSNLYFDYGIAYLYGGGLDGPAFLTDQWWAWYIGEIGFIGFSFFVALMLLLVWRCLHVVENMSPSRELAIFSVTAACALLYGLLTGYADGNLTTPPFAYFSFALLGICLARKAQLVERP